MSGLSGQVISCGAGRFIKRRREVVKAHDPAIC
jgi:hypothetical protein